MSTIHHDNDLAHAKPGRRSGLTALVRGCRDIYLEMGEALADILDPWLHRSPASFRVIVDGRQRRAEPAPAPPTPPQSATRPDEGELIWELRRLLALSGRTLADVARTLETRVDEVDAPARDLLQDELYALDGELATLTALLADPVDWDSEYGRLLAGDVAPFDDELPDDEA